MGTESEEPTRFLLLCEARGPEEAWTEPALLAAAAEEKEPEGLCLSFPPGPGGCCLLSWPFSPPPQGLCLHLAPPFNWEVELNEVVVNATHELFPLLFLHLLRCEHPASVLWPPTARS